jgi:caffeoyl-CoA O-methyltransferase
LFRLIVDQIQTIRAGHPAVAAAHCSIVLALGLPPRATVCDAAIDCAIFARLGRDQRSPGLPLAPDPVTVISNEDRRTEEVIDDRVRAVLDRLERQDTLERQQDTPRRKRLRQVTPDLGRFLHTLVLAKRPGSILEIGTSGGYSTMWLATAARSVGATVVTLEIDPAKVQLATSNLREAGLDDAAAIVQTNALDYLRDRREPIDFAFVDAEKEDYLRYLELIVPLLPIGGLLVADNLISHASDLVEFRRHALSDPRLSAVVVPLDRGQLLAARIG